MHKFAKRREPCRQCSDELAKGLGMHLQFGDAGSLAGYTEKLDTHRHMVT
jgi:hypothetical protein